MTSSLRSHIFKYVDFSGFDYSVLREIESEFTPLLTVTQQLKHLTYKTGQSELPKGSFQHACQLKEAAESGYKVLAIKRLDCTYSSYTESELQYWKYCSAGLKVNNMML